MAQIIERIVRSQYPPRDTRVLWVDTTDDSIKTFTSHGWDKLKSKGDYIAGDGITIDKNGKISCTYELFIVVSKLPTEDIREDKIYLVEESTEEGNIYNEYIYVGNKWEKLGIFRPSLDLTDYANLKKVNTFEETQIFTDGIQFNTYYGPTITAPSNYEVDVKNGDYFISLKAYGATADSAGEFVLTKNSLSNSFTVGGIWDFYRGLNFGPYISLQSSTMAYGENCAYVSFITRDNSKSYGIAIKGVTKVLNDDTSVVNKAYMDEELAKKWEFNEDPNFNNIHCNAIEIGTDDVIDSSIGTYVDRSDGTHMGAGIINSFDNQTLQPLFVGFPTLPNMAATKAYVDNLISQMQTTIDALTQRVTELEAALNEISYVEEETTTSETSE